MRLIDADAFKNILNSGGSESVDINISKTMPLSEIVDIVIQAYRKCLFAELEKMPTAYDVDNVVEQIKCNSQNIALLYPDDQGGDYEYADGIEINRAVEIVRAELKV